MGPLAMEFEGADGAGSLGVSCIGVELRIWFNWLSAPPTALVFPLQMG